jgi:DNA modification methylase
MVGFERNELMKLRYAFSPSIPSNSCRSCFCSRPCCRLIPTNFYRYGLVKLVYLDPPFFSNREHMKISHDQKVYSFHHKWENGLLEYIKFIQEILRECHRVLAKSGSLYLHCDWHASHYLVDVTCHNVELV